MKQPRKPHIPKEDIFNSMTTSKKPISILFRPNNYRRAMRVGIKTNSAIKKILALFPNSLGKHNKLISIKKYHQNITIQYGKDYLTAIYSQNIIGGYKETYHIEADTIDQFDKRIDYYRDMAEKKMDKALLDFSKQFKIYLPFEKIHWKRAENWIKGEEFIDNIPTETIIHDTVFKKVYPEGIELITGNKQNPTATTKQYIKNRCIEDFSPEIAKAIDGIVGTFENVALLPLTEQIELHLEVQRETLKTLKAIRNEKRSLSKEWGW